MKYKLKFKAQDRTWNDVVKFRDRVTAFMNSKGYKIKGDTDWVMLFGDDRTIKPNVMYSVICVNFDKMIVDRSIISYDEDLSYTKLRYFPFNNIELLKFFDSLGFTVDEAMTALTGEKITDWFRKVKK